MGRQRQGAYECRVAEGRAQAPPALLLEGLTRIPFLSTVTTVVLVSYPRVYTDSHILAMMYIVGILRCYLIQVERPDEAVCMHAGARRAQRAGVTCSAARPGEGRVAPCSTA
eukprot:6199580-Pleurochrysis_carterae.AAC.1